MSDDRTAIMSARALAPGYEILWYTIHEVLGQGGFGITYRAHDRNLDRFVALKEYLPTPFAYRHQDYSVKPLTGDHHENYAWGLGSFLKEAQTLAKFGHDNIVRVHSVFEENNTAYMVMEYEQGENLASLYKRLGSSLDQTFFERTFFPIFDGLEQIHAFGFIHRDIKPANIYIRENGTPVLIDFGSARQTSQQQTGEMTTLVSKGYTPLEQYSPNYGDQGPWTDIYALAASLYEGVVGQKPDESLSRSACMLRNKPDLVQRLSVNQYAGFEQSFLDALIAGLALEPEGRPQNLGGWLGMFGRTSTTLPPVTQSLARDAARDTGGDTRTAPPGHFTAAPSKMAPSSDPVSQNLSGRGDEFGSMDLNLNSDDFDAVDLADDMERPATGIATARKSKKSVTKKQRSQSTKKKSKLPLVLSSVAVLAAGSLAGYFFLKPEGSPQAVTAEMVAQLPRPATAIRTVLPKQQVLQQLNDLLSLSTFYKQASDIDSANPEIRSGIDNGFKVLQEVAGNWHASRHTEVADRIAQIASTMPGSGQQKQAITSLLQPTGELTSLQRVTTMLQAGHIATPEGNSVLDEVNKLSAQDYQTLKQSAEWQSMMLRLRESAIEKMEKSDFVRAALIVEAALSLDPDDAQTLRLQNHLQLN
ncbi:MAG: serine/threonine protein kinase [Granulosicoccus sp.]|nr:serine/threonine protein kinase [Granulosicoccus sp.]